MSESAKVLVVDDTPHNVKLLADLLAVKGYAVATAVNGEEALVKVSAERAGSRPARRHDAGAVGLRRVPAHPRRPRHRAPAGRARDVARPAAGAGEGPRGRRRRFPVEADQPGRALRARALAAPREVAAGRGAAAGRCAQGMEREARAARRRAGRRARAHGTVEALLRSRRRRRHPRGGRKIDPRSASPRDLLCVRRPPRLHRLHGHGRARGGGVGAARVPRRDGCARRRIRRHGRPLRRRRHPRLLQRPPARSRPRAPRRGRWRSRCRRGSGRSVRAG